MLYIREKNVNKEFMTFSEIPKRWVNTCLKEIPSIRSNWLARDGKIGLFGIREKEKERKWFPDHMSNSITLIDLPDKDTSIFHKHVSSKNIVKENPLGTDLKIIPLLRHLAAYVSLIWGRWIYNKEEMSRKFLLPQIESKNKLLAMISPPKWNGFVAYLSLFSLDKLLQIELEWVEKRFYVRMVVRKFYFYQQKSVRHKLSSRADTLSSLPT